MNKINLAYCNECEDLVEFDINKELLEDEYKGVLIEYTFNVGRCICCGNEVATDTDYSFRKSNAKIEAYKKKLGLISLVQISEILRKYDIGKEALADVAGFGKVTIKRYFDGIIPSKEYSDILLKMLYDEKFFFSQVKKNKDKLTDIAYRKINNRYERLEKIRDSKTEQIVNYILSRMEDVTPLALQKLLAFSNGVNYAMNDNQLILEEAQAWAHGPVYPRIYNRYKHFGYKPIDDAIDSTCGCMLSKLSKDELRAIDLVINTFGLYSPKVLEKISHMQDPWMEKRIGLKDDELGNEVIDEDSIKAYFQKKHLDSEEMIMKYIMDCIRI